MQIKLRFCECEHYGDMDEYVDYITECGGEVKRTELNTDTEECIITVEVKNKDRFIERLKKTEVFGFCNGY